MKLSREDIVEYQKIHKAIHGEGINENEARRQGMRLIGFIKTVIHPLTRIQHNTYDNRT